MTQQPEGNEAAEAEGSARAPDSISSELPLATIFGGIVSLVGSTVAVTLANPKQGKLVAVALFALGCLLGLYFILKKEKKVSNILIVLTLPFACAAFAWIISEHSATPKDEDRAPKLSQPKVGQPTGKFSLGVDTLELSAAIDGDFPDLVGDRRYGLEVKSVVQNGIGFEAGITVYDVIQRVNDREIKTRMDLDDALEHFCSNSGSVTLGVWRNGRALNLISSCPP